MKTLVWFGLAASLVLPAMAQRHVAASSYGRVSGKAFGFGFGNVVFPGGAPTAPRHPFSITDPGFAGRLGGAVSGFRPYTGRPEGGPIHPASRTVVVPYVFPVFLGGYPPYLAYAPPQQPNVIVLSAQQPAPTVIINQSFAARPETQGFVSDAAGSGVQVYQAPSAPPAESRTGVPLSEPTIYLIAFKDGSIRTALAFWVDGDTFHYVTPQGRPNKASMELVDLVYTRKLNRERNIEFSIPPGN